MHDVEGETHEFILSLATLQESDGGYVSCRGTSTLNPVLTSLDVDQTADSRDAAGFDSEESWRHGWLHPNTEDRFIMDQSIRTHMCASPLFSFCC